MTEALFRELVLALKHCLGLLCESGNLSNYRNLSDAELGKAWVETAKEAADVLNRAEAALTSEGGSICTGPQNDVTSGERQ